MSHINRSIAILSFLVVMLCLSGCRSTMDEISQNPNRSEVINPENLLTYLCINTFSPNVHGLERNRNNFYMDWRFGGAHLNWLRRNFTAEYRFVTISNQMKKEAERLGYDEYIPLQRFFNAYWMFITTRLYGDVPYSESNQAGEGIFLPKYDPQEDIIYGILQELETANQELAVHADKRVSGDFIFDGNLHKWRQLVNTLRIRVLINLTQKQTIKGESVQQLFADIINDSENNPLMQNLEDSPIRYETNNPNNYFIFSQNDFISGYRITKFVADYMKDRQDYRLTRFAQPTIYAENNGLDPNNLQNYAGTNPWPNQENNVNYQYEDSGIISRINNRYHREPVGPPTMVIGYPEQEFILAEAIVRGWITGNAAQHYENGIEASFKYFEVENRSMAYLQQPLVQLTGSNTEKIDKIITQKYLNFFMSGSYEPYFELRRTGYPDFAAYVAPDISTLYNNGRLPLRYLYPLGEINDNKQNITEAISRLPGGDQIFSKMWLLQGQDGLRNPSPFPFQ